MVGTVFMALTFTIVSFTCVAPFLGGFAGIAASGQFRWWELLARGVRLLRDVRRPVLLAGPVPQPAQEAAPQRRLAQQRQGGDGLPGAGRGAQVLPRRRAGWLPEPAFFTYDLVARHVGRPVGRVRAVPAQPVPPRPRRAAGDVSVPRMLWPASCSWAWALYLMPALFGYGHGRRAAAAGAARSTPGSIRSCCRSRPTPCHGDLEWTGNLKRAVEGLAPRPARQYVFVDFTGVTCTNCKLNEQNVFTRPEVRDLFKPYSLVQCTPTRCRPSSTRSGATDDDSGEEDADRQPGVPEARCSGASSCRCTSS